MSKLIDCQVAIVPWGLKAKFKRARIGLLRKNDNVYIIAIFNPQTVRLPLDKNAQIMPAAIRFNNLQQDIFVRQVDATQYSIMVRQIKVILRKEELSKSAKAPIFQQLLSSIPDRIDPKELVASRVSARINVNRDSTSIESSDLALKRVSTQQLDNRKLRSIKITGLETLPHQLWSRPALQELSLVDCNLDYIPRQIESFKNSLTYLNLSNNSILTVPSTFCCCMEQLRFLDISDNNIKELPLEMKFLKKLVEFNISNNQIRKLPTTFTDMINLRVLNVANNKLTKLPAFKNDIIKLDELDVSYNPLNDDEHTSPLIYSSSSQSIRLFNIALLRVARCDSLLKLVSFDSIPLDIVDTLQNDVFKCYSCGQLDIHPAHQSVDVLDYVNQVERLITNNNFNQGMTFVRLLCNKCASCFK